MSSTTSNNKRIAKNTLLLYFRMILTMLVTLYTSRVVLNTLGVEDFGIFNVVGGIVVMFSFLNSAMSSATQRFLSFELGQNNKEQFTKVFSMSITIHALIALIIFVLAETIGLWFLNTHLVIPADRLVAANWVYQCSVLSFMVTILSVPYNASIIAYERMGAFAYISILEVSLKLLAVFILQWIMVDKLKLYAVLLLVVALIIRLVYGFYCKLKLEGCSYSWVNDKKLFRKMTSYSGWMLFGTCSNMFSTQGVNILLNVFFGPIVNTARAIAVQIQSAVQLFISNLMMAVQPQIIKSYACKNYRYSYSLVNQSSKFGFFLIFVISLPIILETEFIINLWLGQTPGYTIIFTRLVLIDLNISLLFSSLASIAQATGNIKKYQQMITLTFIMVFVCTYIAFSFGLAPWVTFIISIAFSLVGLLMRVYVVSKLSSFSPKVYFKKVIAVCIVFSILTPIFPVLFWSYSSTSLLELLLLYILTIISSVIVFLFVVSTKNERVLVKKIILKLYDRNRQNNY